MKLKTIVGWSIIIILSLIPAYLLLAFSPDPASKFINYNETTHTLGQLCALIGMTLFALTFILSARLKKIEDIFGGLDKVYMVHGIMGSLAFVLILFHPILLVLRYIPSNIQKAAEYLLPSAEYWSVNYGILALTGMFILIFITLYSKLRYQNWKVSHKFFGLVFILAVIHIFMVRTEAARDSIFGGYYWYAAIVSLIGISGFVYSSFIRYIAKEQFTYKIDSIREKKGVNEIIMSPVNKPMEYQAGQFAMFRFFNNQISNEPHPFSIASQTNENKIRIVIKNLGDFTSTLNLLRNNDQVKIEGPYGRFYTTQNKSDEVWIAGGIGITPFLGLALDFKEKSLSQKIEQTHKKKIDLFYTAKSDDELFYLNSLKEIESQMAGSFKIYPWISNKEGHLSLDKIQEKVKITKNKQYYLCGPQALKDSIIQALQQKGISKNNIHDEKFNFK